MQLSNARANLIPALFVLLWSTGFIGAKFGLPYAEPFTFLTLRFLLVGSILGVWVLVTRAPWPTNPRLLMHASVAGLLVHAVYLGGVFTAIDLGINAGLAALIVGAQPLLTAALAGVTVGEQISRRQWLGFIIGFGGVSLVVTGEIHFSGDQLAGLLACICALFGITLGTLYQKRHCTTMDLRSVTLVQYLATLVALATLSLVLETREVDWNGEFVFALVWLSVVLSVGAVMLLWWLVRHGGAAKVASFFYLVPPVTAIIAYLLFGETFTVQALVGFALAAAGVAVVHRG